MKPASVQLSNLNLDMAGVKRLKGLTHTIPSDGITALVGANGAGKSLLLRTMHGLIRPTSGKIRWGEHLAQDRRALMRQKPSFLRRSARDNLVFALRAQGWKPKAAKIRADETLTWLQLSDQAEMMASHLSPGQQARLAMARALAIEPAVLLLDEPTASLDPEAALALEELMVFVRDQGTKIILVSHSLGQVKRLAADVLMLDRGKSLFFGPTQTFFDKPSHQKIETFLLAAGFWTTDKTGEVL